MGNDDISGTPREQLFLMADRFRAIADLGLTFSTDEYDRERYRELQLKSDTMARLLAGYDAEDETRDHNPRPYHLSPLCGVDAAVIRNEELLLIRRHDTGKWAMPGGLLEVGETPATGCLRELVEETGVTGRAQRLLGVFDSRLWGYQLQYHLLSFVFLVEHVSGDPHPTPEATEIGYFASDALPPLSAGHEKRVPMMFGLALGQGAGPHFDQ